MTTTQHNDTTIIIDENIMTSDEVHIYELLIKKCLDFYKKVEPTIILVKNSSTEKHYLGLTVQEMNGFILFHNNIVRLTKKHAVMVNPLATMIHCVVDTYFHELHHVESYAHDPQWVIEHKDDEEKLANEVARDLCVEFFKTQNIPLEVKPYIYKSEKEVITDLRKYFNILLDEGNKWDPLTPDTVTPTVINPVTIDTNPINITFADAKILYSTCFNHLKDNLQSPENIFIPIKIPPIIKSAYVMDVHGIIIEKQINNQIAGIIDKNTKTPSYMFKLKDGKQRSVIYNKNNDTGYVSDIETKQHILQFRNNIFSAYTGL